MSEIRHTVLIVDDHPLFRRGLTQLIQTIPSLELIGEASGGSEESSYRKRFSPTSCCSI